MQKSLGIILALVAGLTQGLFLAPLKYLQGAWKFEHSWFVHSFVATLILPISVAFLTVPNIPTILRESEKKDIAIVAAFGGLWGIGNALFGLSASLVGQGLAFSIVLGICASVGSLVPLLVQHWDDATKKPGVFDEIGVGIAVIGIVFLGISGNRREKLTLEAGAPNTEEYTVIEDFVQEEGLSSNKVGLINRDSLKPVASNTKFCYGMTVCVLSGLLSSCFNLAVAFADKLVDKASQEGASDMDKSNIIWLVALPAGGVVNVLYAIFLMCNNKSLRDPFVATYEQPPGWICKNFVVNFFLSVLMAILWFSGSWIYGIASVVLGDLGPAIGFPLFMGLSMTASNFHGWLTGEWKYADKRACAWGLTGNVIIISAVVVVALGDL